VPASELEVLTIDETNVSKASEGRLPSFNRVALDGGRLRLSLASYALAKLRFQ
jgi:hypothetical protein